MSHPSPDILAQASFWLEPPASTSAAKHDVVFYTLLYVTGFFFFLVVAFAFFQRYFVAGLTRGAVKD